MFRIVTFITLIVLLASCTASRSKKSPGLRKDYSTNANGNIDGRYREYVGRFKITEGNYDNGRRSGEWTFYNKNKLVIKGNYVNGNPEGEWKYYRNGKLHVTEWYANGSPVPEKRVMHIPTDGRKPDNEKVEIYTVVQEMPDFNDNRGVLQYLAKTTRYPAEARDNNVTGTIWVEYVVNPLGEVTEAKVVKSPEGTKILEEAALRAINELPRFSPGFQAGVPVSVRFTVPLKFSLKR